ncbi:MAG: isoleucine--tRNA ligase [Ferrimicrobium sp.]
MQNKATISGYSNTQAQLDLPALEHRILEFWEKDDTFHASIENRQSSDASTFVFYDGPPFANGLPHYGHLLTGFVKDAIPRYQTMVGHVVERRFGWDCHGLPAEMASEKELGLAGRAEIEEFGVGAFNEHCRALVDQTSGDWLRYVNRQARWVDFVDAYRTMDLPFMESVIWAFKRLYETGLLYENLRVLPYCWECETPLSNFETRQDDSYRPRIDPAITVAFHVSADPHAPAPIAGDLYLLAWTTTPWTLPSNLALAVSPSIDYSVFNHSGRSYVIAQERLEAYSHLFPNPDVITTVPGSALLDRHFSPLFPFFANETNAFRVVPGEFVSVEEGTGIVQMAPGFGEEDQAACADAGIAIVCPVDGRGRYTAEVPWYEGTQVFDANAEIIEYLRSTGVLVERLDYEHSYPHCWRTDTPLIYRAVSSWFVDVTKIKAKLLAKNQEINWVPEHVKDGAFGRWLEGARDWSITRNRYWGSPIPVWKSDNPTYPRIDVYGSLDELEADFGYRPVDLHRPFIDELTRPNPDDPTGTSTMRRVPDVLDCWFESGSMPFAQLHYPFESRNHFEANFPADFIVEFIGQTRGWFYTLHVLAVALFDEPPFMHCMAHGILLGDDGRKLSKRLKNYPDPWEVFEEIGADAMRWFLLSSSVLRGQEMVLERVAMFDTVKRVINPVWNAYSFLTLYARADGLTGTMATDSPNLLDQYLLARGAQLIDTVTTAFDTFDLSGATQAIEGFLDALNNWYIRRSRDRFWSRRGENAASDTRKEAAYNTLHTMLVTLAQLSAPLLPLLSEAIYQDLTKNRSVHLSDWPQRNSLPRNDLLVAEMEQVRQICSAVHSIRKAQGIRSRLPLRRITVATNVSLDLSQYLELIQAETNVKEVVVTPDFAQYAKEKVSTYPRILGPRLGEATQSVIRAVKEGRYTLEGGDLVVEGIALTPNEYTLALVPNDSECMRVLDGATAVVSLDTSLDIELEREGMVRDLIRQVQQLRKDSGFDVSDRIHLAIAGIDAASELGIALTTHHDELTSQVLAIELTIDTNRDGLNGTDYVEAQIDLTFHGSDIALGIGRRDPVAKDFQVVT